jgi:hypothetical protein
MHVWSLHATAVPQLPAALHVSTPLPEHCMVPGAHATHMLSRHAGMAPEQVACVCQLPMVSHAWMALPRHWVWPGAQPPEQVPPTQVWFEHADPLVQVPVALHVCGVLPLHCAWPGAQTPAQVPLTHA